MAVLQPPEPVAAETAEHRVSPVFATLHGLAGTITFRVPPGMDFDEALATVKGMIPDLRPDDDNREETRPVHGRDDPARDETRPMR